MDILKNPVYIGSRRWRQQLFPDTHPPIISTQVFEQAQACLKTLPQPTATRAAFQQFGTPDHLKAIENKVIKHNHRIDATASLLISEIDHHAHQLTKLKARQEQFLDSLIIPNLTTIDRKRINGKLEELDIEAKQLQAIITKKDFELTQKTDEQFNITTIKQAISECMNLDTEDPTIYRNTLRRLIQDITIYPTKLTFQFRWMAWPWEIDV